MALLAPKRLFSKQATRVEYTTLVILLFLSLGIASTTTVTSVSLESQLNGEFDSNNAHRRDDNLSDESYKTNNDIQGNNKDTFDSLSDDKESKQKQDDHLYRQHLKSDRSIDTSGNKYVDDDYNGDDDDDIVESNEKHVQQEEKQVDSSDFSTNTNNECE